MNPFEFLQSLIAQQRPTPAQMFGGAQQGMPSAPSLMPQGGGVGADVGDPFAAFLRAVAPMGGSAATGLFPQIEALLRGASGARPGVPGPQGNPDTQPGGPFNGPATNQPDGRPGGAFAGFAGTPDTQPGQRQPMTGGGSPFAPTPPKASSPMTLMPGAMPAIGSTATPKEVAPPRLVQPKPAVGASLGADKQPFFR